MKTLLGQADILNTWNLNLIPSPSPSPVSSVCACVFFCSPWSLYRHAEASLTPHAASSFPISPDALQSVARSFPFLYWQTSQKLPYSSAHGGQVFAALGNYF